MVQSLLETFEAATEKNPKFKVHGGSDVRKGFRSTISILVPILTLCWHVLYPRDTRFSFFLLSTLFFTVFSARIWLCKTYKHDRGWSSVIYLRN
jgi:hypothetical protein